MLPFKSIQAETVYLGGSQNIAIGGSPGNHSILLAPDFPMALRVSIQVQKPGDFAEQGYENSYPISQYSLVLVPPGTPNVAKTKTVLASKGGGTCDYVSNHPGVVLEDDGTAKGAIWGLFVGDKSDVYNGDARDLIKEGKTYSYNSSLESSVFIPALAATKSGASIITNAGGQMYVSTKDIAKDDTQKQAQMALTGLALGSALKELGHPDIDLVDMAKYFTNEGSSREYIVIVILLKKWK